MLPAKLLSLLSLSLSLVDLLRFSSSSRIPALLPLFTTTKLNTAPENLREAPRIFGSVPNALPRSISTAWPVRRTAKEEDRQDEMHKTRKRKGKGFLNVTSGTYQAVGEASVSSDEGNCLTKRSEVFNRAPSGYVYQFQRCSGCREWSEDTVLSFSYVSRLCISPLPIRYLCADINMYSAGIKLFVRR